jgi:drug/metabolite transporter (DMT)-like permease
LTLGVTLNHERVSRFEWSAVAVVLLGVILLLWRQHPTDLASDPETVSID